MNRPGNVLVLQPGRCTSVENIDMDDYRELNRLVGGNLGMCQLLPSLRQLGFLAYCDDDAMVKAHPPAPNEWAPYLGQARLRGPVVIVRVEGEMELGLDEADVNFWTSYLISPLTKEARESTALSHLWWQAHPEGFVIEDVGSMDELLRRMGLK